MLLEQRLPDPVRPRLSSWRTRAGRVLVIDHQVPMPDHDSGSTRMYALLLLLRDLGFGVTFVPQNAILIPRYQQALTSQGIEVLGGPGDLDAYLDQVGPELAIVILSRPTVAWANYPMIRSLVPESPIVYDTVDLHFVRERKRAATEGGIEAKRSATFHYDMELSLARLADQVWTVSPEERDALLAEIPDLQVAVVPNIHAEEPLGLTFAQREGVLFVGNFAHLPNVDAAQWLVEEILPLVRQEVPDLTLHLAGSNVSEQITALASDHVVVHGWVPTLGDLYRRLRLSVAPLRFGAGMKGKVGESLSFGVPIVTTSIGAEGLGPIDRQGALVADDAAELARLIVDAYGDSDLWAMLSSSGRALMAQRFSPEAVRSQLAPILSGLGVVLDPPSPA